MASSGQAAWVKYFQGKGDIPTTLKKPSPLFDAADSNKKIGELPAGTQVVYLKTTKYESKALVQYKKLPTDKKLNLGRVTFDMLAKPGVKSSGAVSLKPQSFNVKDRKYSLQDYKRTVLEAIEEHKNLPPNLKTYLTAIFDYYANGSTTAAKVTSIFNKLKNDLPLNDINKDLGEVLGPVAICFKKVINFNGKKLSTSGQVYVPERPNEPLMDYAIYENNRQYIISAKSGTTTNVVKPGDIISLLSRVPAKLNKWKKTKEFAILQILAENSIILGPIKAVSSLYPNLIDTKIADTVTPQNYKPTMFAAFIRQNDYLKTKSSPTLNEIMYECEKILQKETKEGSLNMNAIFAAAIDSIVYYVKFELDSTGIGKWSSATASEIKNVKTYGRVYLRSKNGYTRASDRMGIQV
jgi:hypothetical protein